MAKEQKINLFEYTDYRQYLKDFYEAAKKTRAGFSLRRFSEKAGFGSSNFFKLVMDGDRNLTEKSLPKFMKGLGLNKKEQGFFENLVHFNQATNHESKDRYFQKLLQSQSFNLLKPMERRQYEYYSTWYHAVVRELITNDTYDGNLEKLAASLRPRVTLRDVEKSIKLLEELGFIKQISDGKWQNTQTLVTTGPECLSVVLMNYHKSLLSLVKQELDRVPRERRDVSALTLGVSSELLPEIKKRVQEFRTEILKLVSDQTHVDEVVVLAMQLLPLTKGSGEKKS